MIPPGLLPPPSSAPLDAVATPPRYDRTFLELTLEQEAALQQYVHSRIDECRQEMGLSQALTRGVTSVSSAGCSRWSSGFGSLPESWAWKREVNQKLYDGDLEWRKTYYGADSVFAKSNYSLNTPKRWVRLMNARLNEVQLLTDPFFAVLPQPMSVVASQPTSALDPSALSGPDSPAEPSNDSLAKVVESYMQTAFGKSNLRETMQEARRVALIRNDATVKLSWQRRASTYRGPARVLVNAAMKPQAVLADGSLMMGRINLPPFPMPDGRVIGSGDPIRLTSGLCIYEGDDKIPSPILPGAECLLKDPSFTMPPAGEAVFEDFDNLEQVEIDYEGVRADTLYFKDYLFQTRARSLEESDIHVHVYDETLNGLRATFAGYKTFDDYSAWMTSEGGRARAEQGEVESGSVRKYIGVHETYILFDADGDGQDEWIFCAYDYQQKRFIFRDYLKNHMKEPPFVIIPGVEKVESRAYGTGIYEMAKDKTLFIDLMFNATS